jgi:hypothetical protein
VPQQSGAMTCREGAAARRTVNADLPQAQETASRLPIAQRRPQNRPRGRRPRGTRSGPGDLLTAPPSTPPLAHATLLCYGAGHVCQSPAVQSFARHHRTVTVGQRPWAVFLCVQPPLDTPCPAAPPLDSPHYSSPFLPVSPYPWHLFHLPNFGTSPCPYAALRPADPRFLSAPVPGASHTPKFATNILYTGGK